MSEVPDQFVEAAPDPNDTPSDVSAVEASAKSSDTENGTKLDGSKIIETSTDTPDTQLGTKLDGSKIIETSTDTADTQLGTKLDGSKIIESSAVTPFGIKLDGSKVIETNADTSDTQFGTKPDGSTIDLSVSEDGTCTFTPEVSSQSQTTADKTSCSSSVEEASVSGIETETETSELIGEVVEDDGLENQILEDPLTPATDNSATKSLPDSGRVTPASQSDQSVTFSSSEKSTPSRKVKMSDITGRQIEFDNLSSSSGSVKNVQFPHRVGISWRKGEKLEAMDYLNAWFPAKIRAINEEDMQVLIHFDGWNQRFDEWIDMGSERIRPLVRHSERKGKRKLKGESVRVDPCLPFTSPDLPSKRPTKDHKIGDAVYAKWTDCKMYPAKITNIMASGSYEVIFYDGFKKLVQPINIRPMPGEYKQKTFEINPVPEVVLKKAKMKLDATESVSPDDKSRSKSTELAKPESRRDSSAEKEKKSRFKKKKNIVPVLSSEQLDVCSSTDVNMSDAASISLIKSEPVSTQTEYVEGKVQTECPESRIPVTSSSIIASPTPVQSPAQGTPVMPPKAFVVESDHNHFKCPFDGCGKGFRKEHLLDYHIKYYHINDGGPPPPAAKRRRKTTSTCSTEADHSSGSKKSAAKKNRNLSAECPIFQQDVKPDLPDVPNTYSETGEISTQTSPSKQSDFFSSEDAMRHEFKVQDSMEESSVTDAEDYLKPDELVNCICDFQEENGLMIQCEVCMCWQHAACFGITERTLPKTYVCFVCENPPGVRESSRYIHEQDWFKTGEIASFSYLPLTPMSEDRCNTVKSTHTLVGEIHQLNSVLHSLKLQLKVLRTKDEPKLKQWRLDWDVMESDTLENGPNTETKSVNNTEDGVNTPMQSDGVEDKHGEVKVEIPGIKVGPTETKTENTEHNNGQCAGHAIIAEIKVENVKADADSKHDKPETGDFVDVNAPQMEVVDHSESVKTETEKNVNNKEMNGVQHADSESHNGTETIPHAEIGPEEVVDTLKTDETIIELKNSNEVKQEPIEKSEEGNHSDSTESVVEDPIEVCEKNLLSHILRVQAEISDRFDRIEEQIEMLEAMEAVQSRRETPTSSNVLNDVPQVKRSMRHMLNDLSKVKKMSVFH